MILEKFDQEEIDKLIRSDDWYTISEIYELPEWFIEKYADKLYWPMLSANQNLSERIIEKYQDRVHWDLISCFQRLSEEFIVKHINKLRIIDLLYNEKIKFTKSLLKFLLFKTNDSFTQNIILEKLERSEQ